MNKSEGFGTDLIRAKNQSKIAELEAKNVKLCDMLETVLMKLEDYHKYAEPERNAFIENMPIHIRATLKEESEGSWWCCGADYGKHEPSCKNYKE